MSGPRLVPDSQLVFSAELAAAVGLEEAVLLQQIRSLYLHQPATRREGLAWLHISRAYLLQLMPFWSDGELQRICDSLEAKGLIRCDRRGAARDCLLLALDEGAAAAPSPLPAAPPVPAPAATTAPQHTAVATSPPAGAAQASAAAPRTAQATKTTGRAAATRPARGEGQPLPPDFQPSEDMLELLERFHGVPRAFALQQLEDFTLYWRERGSAGHAWQNKFKQHVQFHWARQQQEQAGYDHGGQPETGGTRRTRDSSLEQDLTDTSWAD